MTKEQVRLKAEEIQKSIFNKWADTYDEDGIIKAMLEFGVYIEELTKQRCLEKGIAYSKYEEPRLDRDSILNIPNLCTNE